MTVGAAHLLAKRHGLTPGKRVLVAGSGPLLLSAAANLAELGVQVVGVLEATHPDMACLRSGGVAKLGPLRRGLALLASHAASAHPVPLRAHRRDGAGAGPLSRRRSQPRWMGSGARFLAALRRFPWTRFA